MSVQARSEATIERVLRAASAVFAKHGVRGGSIHDIAKRSKVSIGSIYHHFGDRDGVALAVFRRHLDELLTAVSHAFVQTTTARAAFDALVDAYLAWVDDNPQAARFLFFAGPAELMAGQSEPLDASKTQRMAPMVERIQAFIQAGHVRPVPLAVLEVIVVGPVAELARRRLSGAPGLHQPEAVAAIKDALWRAVAAR